MLRSFRTLTLGVIGSTAILAAAISPAFAHAVPDSEVKAQQVITLHFSEA